VRLLSEYDSEFSELFKIAADFDETVDRTADTLSLYARIIAGAAQRERLRPIEAGGVARLVEHGSRLAGDSRKLSIHQRSLEDVLREADHFAGISGSDVVRPVDIQRALDEQVRRLGRVHALTLEAIRHESLLIECDGEAIGQVNGLSVVQVGPQLFGRPSRITASVRIGDGEVLDIEREVKLGGAIHSKGVLILSALIGERFGVRLPLSLHASLASRSTRSRILGGRSSGVRRSTRTPAHPRGRPANHPSRTAWYPGWRQRADPSRCPRGHRREQLSRTRAGC
jgi:predicted ATP-dependent protease